MRKILILIFVVTSGCSPVKQITDHKTSETKKVHFKRHVPRMYKVAAVVGFVVGLTIVGPLLYENVPAIRNKINQ